MAGISVFMAEVVIMAMKSDYDYRKASDETREAMNDRCQTQGHQFENGASFDFGISVYQFCIWCGERK